MTVAVWSDIQTEHEAERIGLQILAEVERAVELAVRRYDPMIYAKASSWDDARDDLVQDVVVKVLLEENQLEYLMTVSRGLDDFRALLFRQVRRLLARRRQRSVIDNLLDRSRTVFDAGGFNRTQRSGVLVYKAAGANVEARRPTDAEIRRAAVRVSLVATTRFRSGERAPEVYSPTALATVLKAIAEVLPCEFALSDLDQILRLTLTDWIPSFLDGDEQSDAVSDHALNPEEETIVRDTASRILASCSKERQLILTRKLEGLADEQVAQEIGISRPTLANRKEAVWRILENELRDLSEALQLGVTREIGSRLAASIGQTDG